MTRSQAERLLRRHQDALNRHDVAALRLLYAEDAVVVSPMFRVLRGREAIGQAFEHLFALFPGYRTEVSDAPFLHEGDRVAEFSAVAARHDVELFGLPATGQPVEYRAARLFTFRDGLIVHEQRIYDFAGMIDRLEKARTDQELSTASEVQHTLFGRPSRTGGHYRMVAASIPSRAISGDFLESLDLPGGAFGMAVGDVSGKGPAAALVAAMLQGMLSTVARDGYGPSEILSWLNRALCGREIEQHFATMALVVLAPDGRLTYSLAGHHPPLCVGSAGTARLDVGGPPLGVFEDSSYPEATVTLAPGDAVLAFSDGVTEAVSPTGEFYEVDRLVAAALEYRELPVEAWLERLLGSVRAFSGDGQLTDDVTMAVIRYQEP